jgi:glucose-1-phosphate thymidylyltransferase
LEEIAYSQGWISNEQLVQQGNNLKKTGYGQYLLKVAAGYS